MSKLTELERTTIILPEIAKIREVKPDPEETQLNEIDRINRELREKYPGREFCFAAVLQKDGTYEFSIDDVKPTSKTETLR